MLKTLFSNANPHYSREMRDQSQAVAIAHNYANGLFDEVFCNEISGPGVLVAWADFGRSDELFGLNEWSAKHGLMVQNG